jgi:hypothetical protein
MAPAMSTSDLPAGVATKAGSVQRRMLLAAVTAALFVSAALLFAVQPMFTKMVLPRLGGAPSVWSVAMVFFQAALLAGYGYAHLITRFAPGRPSVLIHLAVLATAALTLPLAIATGWGTPPETGEAFWLLGLFAVSIGLPFFALAANSPLLQAWFARTDHPAAKDPYFLYAASNVGSFLALIAYPTVIEPLVRLGDQTWLWSIGFFVLIALIAGCGALLWRMPAHSPDAGDTAAARPTWRDTIAWVALAALPSGLLVAVTAHISTDVGAAPLLWVIPLALYLLTFVIAFARRPPIPHRIVVVVQPLCVFALVVVQMFPPFDTIFITAAVHFFVFFVCALMCHGELARRRPAPRHLTSFYLWMSAGGMIGGIAAGLVAPFLFDWVIEYPILLALALLCRWSVPRPRSRAEWVACGVAAAVALAFLAFENVIVGGLLLAAALFWRIPVVFAAIVAFMLTANHYVATQGGMVFVRSFFGVNRVAVTDDGRYRLLHSGSTVHGVQRLRDAAGYPVTGRIEPLGYYFDGAPIVQVIEAAQARANAPVSIAVIGLGAGALACRARTNDTMQYFEIDPAVVEIAGNRNWFNFLSDCYPDISIVLGDARLTLAGAEDASFDVIVVDAFSSDAIPIHLLTREAMELYRRKLAPRGVIALHISNRHLELASVAAGIAAANGLVTRVHSTTRDDDDYKLGQVVAVAARSEEDLGALAKSPLWAARDADPGQWVWTDDYSNMVGAMIRKLRQ